MTKVSKRLLTIAIAAAMVLSMSMVLPQTAFGAVSATNYEYGKHLGPFPGVPNSTSAGGVYHPECLTVAYDFKENPSTGRKDATKGGKIYDWGEVISNRVPKGVNYDPKTNVLTLDHFVHPDCEITGRAMGDDFTINVIGDCEIGCIDFSGQDDENKPATDKTSMWWGSSLTFTGPGTLTVNKNKIVDWAIELTGWGCDARITIDETVSLKAYGRKVTNSTLPAASMYIMHTAGFNYKDAFTVMRNGKPKPITSLYPNCKVGAETNGSYLHDLHDYWITATEVNIKGKGYAPHLVNPITVKGKNAKVSYKKLKKKNQGLARSKVLTIKKAKGTLTFTKKSGNKKITINKKTGKVTVKKGLGKGTYAVKVTIKDDGNKTYHPGTRSAVFTVKVK